MGKRILVVDDSSTFRTVTNRTLAREGFEVVEADDGFDALNKMSGERRFDLVICDLNMPRMNGLEFLAELKARSMNRFTPVLMLTTESAPEKKAQAKSAGAAGWLSKPFEPKQLLGAVSVLIR
jgi:two-component system chemotaxis response regulator CheY